MLKLMSGDLRIVPVLRARELGCGGMARGTFISRSRLGRWSNQSKHEDISYTSKLTVDSARQCTAAPPMTQLHEMGHLAVKLVMYQ